MKAYNQCSVDSKAPAKASKADKSKMNKDKAETEYQEQINKLSNYQPEWEFKLASTYDSLQDLEQTRMEMVQHSVDKYISGERMGEDFVKQSCSRLKTNVDKVQVANDLSDWIRNNKTSTEPPKCPSFVSFSQEAFENMPTSSTHKDAFRKSIGRLKKSIANKTPITTTKTKEKKSEEKKEKKTPSDITIEKKSTNNSKTTITLTPTTENVDTPKKKKSAKKYCIALYDYDAQEENELTFKENDKILLHETHDSGWWTGEINGTVGLFPQNYVSVED
eukprot:TRINITY_DN8000_c0_g1_i1.p1 TRINITY_DN8000_c0_g1~~TRINITY_DN8000_c0_g1_i1.p1  ORF type:complete len:277 (-),score=61.65 TRINITY_DN8000_c0_g1_i1:36-866(-)